ncbi:MAG: alpha/beta hydrolase [Tannerella sp.]|jgi:pimeloyl-ACP methyl ester carboxylesterase|nr:alpha/beta hydrolase [Tannerella sp.]
MKFNVSGNPSATKKGLMLHGMTLNGNAMMTLVGNTFGSDYHIIFPTFDGHHKEDKTIYTTISDQADKIIAYLEYNGLCDLDFVMGVSLGAMTALEILQREKLNVRRYVLDGLPFADFNSIKRNMIKMALGYVFKQTRKHPAKRNYIDKMFGSNAPEIKDFAMYADKTDISVLVDQGFSGKVPEHLDMSEEDIIFVYGSQDGSYSHFRKFQKKYPDGYRLIVKEGYKHCQYFRENVEEYAEIIKDTHKKTDMKGFFFD